MSRIRIAIIGTGNIGTDLAERLLKDERFDVHAFIGRRENSEGLQRLEGRIPHLLTNGADGLRSVIEQIDGVFDATSAFDHAQHWEIAQSAGKWAMDLTPSKIGRPAVPALEQYLPSLGVQANKSSNYSMVTCGGQSSAAVVWALCQASNSVRQVEISSSIASLSAGPATRKNIDQYVESTENLLRIVSGVDQVKAILVVNPATPPIMMRTTVTVEAGLVNVAMAKANVARAVAEVQNYVPGYALTVDVHHLDENTLGATVKVTGAGHYLPSYAGNLDIINAAAVEMAVRHAGSGGTK
jgi:acetaldehyde dehydrogenase (acetylating)